MSTSETYEEAVRRVIAVQEAEPDPAKRQKAADALTEINVKRQEAGFGGIVNRTRDLAALVAILQQLVDNISTGGPISGSLGQVRAQIDSINQTLTG